MSQSIQLIVVVIIVLACLGFVAQQTIGFVRGKKSQIGKCCSKGCSEVTSGGCNRT